MQALPNLQYKSNSVLKLKHAIYGLKQSARAWNQQLNDCLLALGYVELKLEPRLYSKKLTRSRFS